MRHFTVTGIETAWRMASTAANTTSGVFVMIDTIDHCSANIRISASPNSTCTALGIGPNDAGGYGLTVHLEVVIPDLPHDQAQALADQAHQVCPYSNATRGNIEVTVDVTDD